MVLNSLLRRLNGGTDTKSTTASSSRRQHSPVVYEKYSNLSALLVRLLSSIRHEDGNTIRHHRNPTAPSITDVQKVFPALEIIERFGFPHTHCDKINELVQYHLESPVWPIREKAAKTFAHVVPEPAIGREVGQVLEVPISSQNRLHGKLLCVRYMLSRKPSLVSKLLLGRHLSRLLYKAAHTDPENSPRSRIRRTATASFQ